MSHECIVKLIILSLMFYLGICAKKGFYSCFSDNPEGSIILCPEMKRDHLNKQKVVRLWGFFCWCLFCFVLFCLSVHQFLEVALGLGRFLH